MPQWAPLGLRLCRYYHLYDKLSKLFYLQATAYTMPQLCMHQVIQCAQVVWHLEKKKKKKQHITEAAGLQSKVTM